MISESQFADILHTISVWCVPILMAITFHEAAHGFVAKRFGDTTAFMLGRVTLNPFKHIDPVGTIALPGALLFMGLPAFGYARPVPVNFNRLKPYTKGVVAVAAAGPLMNLLLAIASMLLMHIALLLPDTLRGPLMAMLIASIQINILLMVFNLIPLPPLDGGRIVSVLLKGQLGVMYAGLERYGMWVVLLGVLTGTLFPLIQPVMTFVLSRVKNIFTCMI